MKKKKKKKKCHRKKWKKKKNWVKKIWVKKNLVKNSQNLKRNGWKLLYLGRPHLLGPKIAPFPQAPFGQKLEICILPHFRHYYAKRNCKIANVKNIRIHRYEASYLGAPKKGQHQKRAQICPIWNFLFLQVEIPSNNEYRPNLKPNGWKLLHLWPTALSGTQNCPIPIGPFWGTIRNLGNYHLLDIITKEKPAKFQIKRTAGSKV